MKPGKAESETQQPSQKTLIEFARFALESVDKNYAVLDVLQKKAESLGIIKIETVTAPCGVGCICEIAGLPAECYVFVGDES